MCAQTGDEWSATLELCEKHMLRMFREHNVRLVEVARRGPSQRDGIVVLQDTHSRYGYTGTPRQMATSH